VCTLNLGGAASTQERDDALAALHRVRTNVLPRMVYRHVAPPLVHREPVFACDSLHEALQHALRGSQAAAAVRQNMATTAPVPGAVAAFEALRHYMAAAAAMPQLERHDGLQRAQSASAGVAHYYLAQAVLAHGGAQHVGVAVACAREAARLTGDTAPSVRSYAATLEHDNDVGALGAYAVPDASALRIVPGAVFSVTCAADAADGAAPPRYTITLPTAAATTAAPPPSLEEAAADGGEDLQLAVDELLSSEAAAAVPDGLPVVAEESEERQPGNDVDD